MDWRELWQYRQLLGFLAWRDLKVRYKQTVLGAAWALLQPAMNMILFTVVFSRMAHMPSEGVPYPLFVLAGLIPWTFFSSAISTAGQSLVGNAHLITKVYFPRLIIPVSPVLSALVDLLVTFLLLFAVMAWYRVPFNGQLLLVPLLVVLTAMLAVGVGTALAAVTVAYRDPREDSRDVKYTPTLVMPSSATPYADARPTWLGYRWTAV